MSTTRNSGSIGLKQSLHLFFKVLELFIVDTCPVQYHCQLTFEFVPHIIYITWRQVSLKQVLWLYKEELGRELEGNPSYSRNIGFKRESVNSSTLWMRKQRGGEIFKVVSRTKCQIQDGLELFLYQHLVPRPFLRKASMVFSNLDISLEHLKACQDFVRSQGI